MKIILLSVFALTLLVSVNAESCETFMDCAVNECCKDLGLIKRCLELRDDGESCGGKFLCECKLGYTCKDREDSVWNTFKLGTGHCKAVIK